MSETYVPSYAASIHVTEKNILSLRNMSPGRNFLRKAFGNAKRVLRGCKISGATAILRDDANTYGNKKERERKMIREKKGTERRETRKYRVNAYRPAKITDYGASLRIKSSI